MDETRLSPEQKRILKDKGTEVPFTGALLENKADGTYVCASCSAPLFSSDKKFESGSGWPSFFDVINEGAVDLVEDNTHGMRRTEVVCKKCGGHLGHAFEDGPSDKTGLRYCINSVSLNFQDNDKNKPMLRGDGRENEN